MAALKWEHVKSEGFHPRGLEVHRTEVPGGWLVYVQRADYEEVEFCGFSGVTFYPDPDHKWDPDVFH